MSNAELTNRKESQTLPRGTGLGFKHLALGSDSDTKNYFWFAPGKQRDFFSPVHKHNFDQVRYAYQGSFNLTPHLTIQEGQLAYHPEGVEYGPQNDGPEERVLLVLQCGGASGQGFLSHAQLKQANVELSQQGKFEKGKYVTAEREVVDGYQAIWEHTMGRKLAYPKGRYQEPIALDPEAFAWRPVAGGNEGGINGHTNGGAAAPAVWKRTLGVFSERELRLEGVKFADGGAVTVGGDDAIHLLFVLNGAGSVGDERLEQESTIRLNAGASAEVSCTAQEGLEMLHFVLPLVY